MSSIINKMESNFTGLWVNFFTAAGIPADVAATYALTFTENRIQNDMLLDLNKEYLRDMGITRMGDVIAILRHAKQVHECTARDRVLSTAVTTTKVPVAAVTGRATVTQPASPASRMLEHYTRNIQTQEPVAVSNLHQKRKMSSNNSTESEGIKKARLIRFGTPPPTQPAAVALSQKGTPNKQTVFARLGNIESGKMVTHKAPEKQIYSRLGTKSNQSEGVPLEEDALKYEGILKSTPPTSKKVLTVTTMKNNMRKVAVGTMRADETPISIKEKLALSKPKSVKFSNHIQYKEIEVNKSALKNRVLSTQSATFNVARKNSTVTKVFNKPERRLSMPEGVNTGVKSRLSLKNTNDLTITRNVFNRLGV